MNPSTADPGMDPFAERVAEPRPRPGLWDGIRAILKPLASLQLTVVLFALSIVLVFFGTLAQIDFGIWTVVDKYFYSWYVLIPVDLIHKFCQVFLSDYFPKGAPWAGSFPFPGGITLGLAMFMNLLAAHLIRFRLSWRRAGIILIHSGVALLLVGEFVTREYAVEQRMVIEQGETANYSFSIRSYELAFVDSSAPSVDSVVVIPEKMLRRTRGRITHPDLPADVEVIDYMVNARLTKPDAKSGNRATAGVGLNFAAEPRKEASGISNDEMDFPAAYVRLYKPGTDQEIGTYLVALQFSRANTPQMVRIGDKEYDLSLRFQRFYKPFTVLLEEFRFDRYLGTNKAKNYSSKVLFRDPEGNQLLETSISMNHPLRYQGETFYQSGFNEETEKGTVLSVVRNPGWTIPYVSCTMVTLGLLLHFGMNLIKFLTRRAAV